MSGRSCSRFRRATTEASFTGNIDTVWQMPLEDVGPDGVDKGAGGKYLILPPGYKEPIPSGYIALPRIPSPATRCSAPT